MLRRLRDRPEWKFFAVLPRAGRGLALAWWTCVVLRGVLAAVLAVTMGGLVRAVNAGQPPGPSLIVVGTVFVLLQVTPPVHQALSANLGNRVSAWLNDRLAGASVRPPGV